MKRIQDVFQGIVITIVCGGMLVLAVYGEVTPDLIDEATALVSGSWDMGGTVLVWFSWACAGVAALVFAYALYKAHGNGGGFAQSYRVNIKD